MDKNQLLTVLGTLGAEMLKVGLSALQRGRVMEDIARIQKVLADFDNITEDTVRKRVEDAQTTVDGWWKIAKGEDK